jgi:hypothetical protein
VLQIRQQQAAVLEYTSDMQALQRATLDQRRSIAQLQQQLRPHSPGTASPPTTVHKPTTTKYPSTPDFVSNHRYG